MTEECPCRHFAQKAYTPAEAARLKSVSTDTIMRAIHSWGDVPYLNAKKLGKRYLIFRRGARDLVGVAAGRIARILRAPNPSDR